MLNHIFQEACRSGGSRTALVFDNQRYSFAQLEEQVARCAASLKSAGAVPERGVALVLRTSPEFVYTFLAAARLGIPAYLVDAGSKLSELRRVFTENQIAAVVAEPEQLPAIEQLRDETGQRFATIPAAAASSAGSRTGPSHRSPEPTRRKLPRSSTPRERPAFPNARLARTLTWPMRQRTSIGLPASLRTTACSAPFRCTMRTALPMAFSLRFTLGQH